MYIFLFALWVIFNGRITAEILAFGVFVAGFVFWFAVRFLEYNPKWEMIFMKNFFRIIRYLIVLAAEIVKSSMTVFRIVWSGKISIQPVVVFVEMPLRNEFMRTVLANSITLTPGTITVDVEDNVFCIHALDYTMAEDLDKSIFVKLLKEVEDEHYGTNAD